MAGVHLERSRKWRLHLDDSGGSLLDVAGVHLEHSRKWRLHLDDSAEIFLKTYLVYGTILKGKKGPGSGFSADPCKTSIF